MPFNISCHSVDISIHAPAKGATLVLENLLAFLLLFQSTHPRRVRRFIYTKATSDLQISIHAPAKGATTPTTSTISFSKNFNPRTREGCDKDSWGKAKSYGNFNPRTREGCDVGLRLLTYQSFLFQSTHPRRVRQSVVLDVHSTSEFQSTHPRRVRRG